MWIEWSVSGCPCSHAVAVHLAGDKYCTIQDGSILSVSVQDPVSACVSHVTQIRYKVLHGLG